MFKLYRTAVALVFVAVAAVGAAPDDGPIVLPPAPKPKEVPVVPGSRVAVGAGTVYVFHTTAPCAVRAFPSDAVTIKAEPVAANETYRIRDAFFDGSDTKTFKGPCTVYSVAPAKTASVDLLIVPFGLKAEADIKTVPLDVTAGEGPRPPPKPDDPPVDPPVVKSFRVIFITQATATTPAQANVIGAKAVRDYLNANCTKEGARAGWRQYTPDQVTDNETPVMKALWGVVTPKLPNPFVACVAIEVNSAVEIVNFPATPAAAVALFDKYLGKK